ncbi:MAG: 50S ribosomal protein L16 3-hydroxylase [Methylophagaceae bacterium]|jgi:50S ribosomal protein L16 3-hydroxylase
MTAFFNTGLTQQQFLDQYWQKKPLLIRQAFPRFESPISPDELAGLAYEPDVESRLIVEEGTTSAWQVTQGPFTADDFANLPESHWTLLVQDVDKHVPETQSLLVPFQFIPNWRRDDLMISYAPLNGSVGPHTDGYDVFLLQGLGVRKWQVTDKPIVNPPLIEEIDLQVLSEFEYVNEWLLEPGDMLYLPPHFGHHGVAMNECMTLSIGFRAPTQMEAMDALLNDLLEQGAAKQHYSDVGVEAAIHDHEINAQAVTNLKELLHQTIDAAEPLLLNTLGKLVTETKPSLADLTYALLDEPTSVAAAATQFEQGFYLQKSPYHRFAWAQKDTGGQVFVAGQTYPLIHCHREHLILLTEQNLLTQLDWNKLSREREAIETLCLLIAEGAWLWQLAE